MVVMKGSRRRGVGEMKLTERFITTQGLSRGERSSQEEREGIAFFYHYIYYY
jgi:hypothetical protein